MVLARVAVIHPAAGKRSSRKLIFGFANAHSLGPGERTSFGSQKPEI